MYLNKIVDLKIFRIIGGLRISKFLIVFELYPKNHFWEKPFLAPGQKKPQRKFLGLVFQVHMDPNLPPGGNARNITSQLQG